MALSKSTMRWNRSGMLAPCLNAVVVAAATQMRRPSIQPAMDSQLSTRCAIGPLVLHHDRANFESGQTHGFPDLTSGASRLLSKPGPRTSWPRLRKRFFLPTVSWLHLSEFPLRSYFPRRRHPRIPADVRWQRREILVRCLPGEDRCWVPCYAGWHLTESGVWPTEEAD